MWRLCIKKHDDYTVDYTVVLSKEFDKEQDAQDYLDVFYIIATEILGVGYDFTWDIYEADNSDNANAIEEIINALIKTYIDEFIKSETGNHFDYDYVANELIEEVKNGDMKDGLIKVAYQVVNAIPTLKYKIDKDKFLEEIPEYIKNHI